MFAPKALVDIRTYTIKLRKMPAFIEVFDRLAMPIQVRHLGAPLATYTSAVGTLNQFIHLWGYDSMADMETRVAARDKDPDWPAYLAATAELILAQEDRLVRRAAMPFLEGLK